MVDGLALIVPPSMMGYCLGSLKVCDADKKWKIRF
jgi:hypothetical protein